VALEVQEQAIGGGKHMVLLLEFLGIDSIAMNFE
jgi:hypothetical protein